MLCPLLISRNRNTEEQSAPEIPHRFAKCITIISLAQSHGFWLEVSVSHHLGLPVDLLEYPDIIAAGFPHRRWSKRVSKRDSIPFKS